MVPHATECREVSVIDIEGLAMVGKILSYTVEGCGDRRSRVRAELDSGEVLCTPCIDIEEIELSRRVLDFYTKVVRGLVR